MTLVQTEPKKITIWRLSSLPAEYQEVEYIESSGTQYIDTGVKASNTLSTELVMQPNMSYTSEYAILGDAWSANALFLMEFNGKYRLHNGGGYGDFANITNEKTTIITNNTGITINGNSYSLTAGSSYSNNNIWLFNTGDNGYGGSKKGYFKVYSFKIKNNGTPVRDFVPCYRKADSVIGLYDLVSNQFYINSGTGTFTKGNDINSIVEKEVKRIMMRPNGVEKQIRPDTGWTPGANTIAYYPLESSLNDALGNYNATSSDGTVTYGQIGGSTINAAFFDTTKCSTSLSTVANTINIWFYKPTNTNDPSPEGWKQIIGYNTGDPGNGIWIRATDLNRSSGKLHMVVASTFSSYTYGNAMNQWINLCCTTDGTTRKFYVNGQEVASVSGGFGTSTGNLWFACVPRESGTYGRPRMYLSHIVLESTTRTATEITNYYNQTKSLYGIS